MRARLQAILDSAPARGGLHLVMDGAALIRGLAVHSNTTIECRDRSCGFYLAAQSNGPLLHNAHPRFSGSRLDRVTVRNVTGTYRSFGFFIGPWYNGKAGHFGSIVFGTIDLRASTPNYTYTPASDERSGSWSPSAVRR